MVDALDLWVLHSPFWRMKYVSHAFRIGGASQARLAGVNILQIQNQGRWGKNSKAVEHYTRQQFLRMTPDQLYAHTKYRRNWTAAKLRYLTKRVVQTPGDRSHKHHRMLQDNFPDFVRAEGASLPHRYPQPQVLYQLKQRKVDRVQGTFTKPYISQRTRELRLHNLRTSIRGLARKVAAHHASNKDRLELARLKKLRWEMVRDAGATPPEAAAAETPPADTCMERGVQTEPPARVSAEVQTDESLPALQTNGTGLVTRDSAAQTDVCEMGGGTVSAHTPGDITMSGDISMDSPPVQDADDPPHPAQDISPPPSTVGGIEVPAPSAGSALAHLPIAGGDTAAPPMAPLGTTVDQSSDPRPGRAFELSRMRGSTGSLHRLKVLVQSDDESPELGPEAVLVTPGKTCHVERDDITVEVLSPPPGKRSTPSTWQAYRKALMFNEGTPAPSTVRRQVPGARQSLYRHKRSRVPRYRVMTENGFMVVDAAQYRRMFPDRKRLPSTVIARENGDTASKIRRRVSMRWREFRDTMAQRRSRVRRGLPVTGPPPAPVKMNRSVDTLINHFFDDCLEGGDAFLPPPLPFRDTVDPDDAWVTRALEFYADNPPEAVQRARDENGHQGTTPGQASSQATGAKGSCSHGPRRGTARVPARGEGVSEAPVTSQGTVNRSHLLRTVAVRRVPYVEDSPPPEDDDSDWSP